jgi:two-component system CheB/CheR fusion protein
MKSFLNTQAVTRDLLIEEYSPPAVLANNKGDILFISGKTGKYLEPAAGKANWNIFAMARDGIRYELTGAFSKAVREKKKIEVKNVEFKTNGNVNGIDLVVHPLEKPEELKGLVMIVFKDVVLPLPFEAQPENLAAKKNLRSLKIVELQKELNIEKQKSQVIHEEMQASNEELQSTNEELQSTNEELQSTNEELTTSKEELQSMNEELQTLNSELQIKIDQLSISENDMKNLLDGTGIAILFLDENLKIRRFTNEAARIINLIPGDIGRPVTDISTNLIYSELSKDVQQVLRVLVRIEKQIKTVDGKWFTISILPYRTVENRIDGVVVSFNDINELKKMEEKYLKDKAELKIDIAKLKEIIDKSSRT